MTDWTKQNWIPKNDLAAWHFYKEGDSADGNANDYSGNNRHITTSSNKPVLTPNVFKGNYGWYFDGTRNPLVYSGSVTMKHVFVLMAFEEATTFAEYRGVLSGRIFANGNFGLLTGETGDDRFFKFGPGLTPFSFYKNGIGYVDPADYPAPMGGNFALIEAVVDNVQINFDGIQVGRNQDFAVQLHKGWWMDQVIYFSEKTGEDRRLVYEYFATRYYAWQKNADGVDVWPFQPEAEHGLVSDKLVLSSMTVSGSRKSRSKSSAKDAFQLVFEERTSEEYDAARKFWDEHYPGTSLIYRDDAYSPARDRTVQIISPLTVQRAGFNKLTYTLELLEV